MSQSGADAASATTGVVQGEVSSLHVYPVKSCGRLDLTEIVVGPHGPLGDREWQVVDDSGQPVTQRQSPALARVRPTLADGALRLEAPGLPPIEVKRPEATDRTVTTVLGDEVRVADAGDDAASWFSTLTGTDCRLVAVARGYERRVAGLDAFGSLSLVDAAQVLLTSESSLQFLLDRSSEPFDMARFRPNVVVRGAPAWVEDRWRTVLIGDATLDIIVPWPRCAIPQVDQETAERHREPARVLKEHRWCGDASTAPEALRPFLAPHTLFGVGCSITPVGATVRVGDPVYLIEESEAFVPMLE
jgi:uncharacterized protein